MAGLPEPTRAYPSLPQPTPAYPILPKPTEVEHHSGATLYGKLLAFFANFCVLVFLHLISYSKCELK